MPTYAVVHATVSGMLRRVITDDDGVISLGMSPYGVPQVICTHADGPPGYHPLAPGESAVIMEADNASPAAWKQAIRTKSGKAPEDITCALIDTTNTVTAVIMADPAVDDPPDQRLMVACYAPQIGIGYSYDPDSGLFTSPEGLIPPHTPGNDTDDPITVPPTLIAKP